MTDYKDSPLGNQHIVYPESKTLRVHFTYFTTRNVWWQRWFWWPRPQFSHVAVEWDIFVHNLTRADGIGFHFADQWLSANPPSLTLEIPAVVSFQDAQWLVRHYLNQRMQLGRSLLWKLGIRRDRWMVGPPTNCATLVMRWIRAGINDYDSDYLITPDEIYERYK